MKFSTISLYSVVLLSASAAAIAIPDATGVGIPPLLNITELLGEPHLDIVFGAEIDHEKRNTAPKYYTTSTALKNQMLQYHNAYRAHHGAKAMTWSTTLAKAALVTAKKCVYAHTTPYKYGENLAGGSASYNNPAYMVYLWYSEVAKYNFNKPGYSDAVGHFTQVVWKSSTQIGCAWVTGCAGTNSYPNMLWCEYSPNGNILPNSNFASNVGKPVSSAKLPATPPMSV